MFEIIHEDEFLLLINKPAGLVCHPTKGDLYSSLISRARLYLGTIGSVHLINRLDRETSGIVLIAKTDPTAAALRRYWETGIVRKTYIAVVEGLVREPEGEIDLPIGPDLQSAVAIKGCVCPDGAPSHTRYQRLHNFKENGMDYSVIKAMPRTGRKHQIRIHLAHLGHPIVGDKIYGWDEQCYLDFIAGRLGEDQVRRLRLRNHALHGVALEWEGEGGGRRYVASLPTELEEFITRSAPGLECRLLD